MAATWIRAISKRPRVCLCELWKKCNLSLHNHWNRNRKFWLISVRCVIVQASQCGRFDNIWNWPETHTHTNHAIDTSEQYKQFIVCGALLILSAQFTPFRDKNIASFTSLYQSLYRWHCVQCAFVSIPIGVWVRVAYVLYLLDFAWMFCIAYITYANWLEHPTMRHRAVAFARQVTHKHTYTRSHGW